MTSPDEDTANNARRKALTPAAGRALAEAASKAQAAAPAGEVGGPRGPEPTRYGDWEKKGLASDF